MTITLDESKQAVILVFPIDYYSYGAIMHASNDFTEHFWVSIGQDDSSSIRVSLEPKEKKGQATINLLELGYEFYNYVLGTMQQMSV